MGNSAPSAPVLGAVYQVHQYATLNPSGVGANNRPMACVTLGKEHNEWKAIGRSTTDVGELKSPKRPDIGLDKDGYWSLRWLHSVMHTATNTRKCKFKGQLPDSERDEVLDLYRKRNKTQPIKRPDGV